MDHVVYFICPFILHICLVFFMYASGIIGMFSIIVDIRLDLSQFFVQSCTVLLYKAI